MMQKKVVFEGFQLKERAYDSVVLISGNQFC